VRNIKTGEIIRHETTTGKPANAEGQSIARKAAATKRGDATRAKKAARADVFENLRKLAR
jgi:hypothetical protein